MTNTDPKYVSFEIDILWTFFPGVDPAALISKYPKRFKLLHLKDLRKGIEGNIISCIRITNFQTVGMNEQLRQAQLL